jgi:hypothetical protein
VASFTRTQELEHEIGPLGRFSLRATSADVRLLAGDDGMARVRATFEIRASSEAEADEIFERAKLRAERADRTLTVSEPRLAAVSGLAGLGELGRILGMGGWASAAEVEASVPPTAEIRHDTVNADARVTGLHGVQSYTSISGDLVLSDVGGTIHARSVSGVVSLRGDAPIRLQAGSVSGDVSLLAPRFDELQVTTVSGDVDVEGRLAPVAAHRVETTSGDLTLGLIGGLAIEVRGLSTDLISALPHRSEGSRDRRRYVFGTPGAELLFSSLSGDVTVGTARRITDAAPQPHPAHPTDEQRRLEILHALERGEIDVDEAAQRIGAL